MVVETVQFVQIITHNFHVTFNTVFSWNELTKEQVLPDFTQSSNENGTYDDVSVYYMYIVCVCVCLFAM